jgi:hypothetical protein
MMATDKQRLDWLCQNVVEVRSPFPLGGSKHILYATPPGDDDAGDPSDLRQRIDAALTAAQSASGDSYADKA